MCYDGDYQTKRQFNQAKRLQVPDERIIQKQHEMIEREKRRLGEKPEDEALQSDDLEKYLPAYYHISGFAKPQMAFMTSLEKADMDIGIWGFVPAWVKTVQEAYDFKKPFNRNLNVQSETMFEKRGFKASARHMRCVISMDAYYESHHQNKTTYPFRIYHADGSPLWLAGIYRHTELTDEKTGEVQEFNSVAVVTTQANSILARIHNNPKLVERTGHRMLVLLDESQLTDYLKPYPDTKDPAEEKLFEAAILNLCQPYDEDKLAYDPVRNLKKRKDMDYIGNVPEIRERYHWPDLNLDEIFT
ncbi:MAG: SOS response-associated peptidase family protein [Cyclobacteriaceae bacterium]